MRRKLIIILIFAMCICPQVARGQDVGDLDSQITQKKKEVDEIKKQMAIYQKNIRLKQDEAASLKNQLDILENQIAKTNLDISATKSEVAQVNLEVRKVELDIVAKEEKINTNKDNLAELLQEVNKQDSKSLLDVLLLNDSISSFFTETEYIKNVEYGLQDALGTIKEERAALLRAKKDLDNKEIKLTELKDELELRLMESKGETEYRNTLLVETNKSERKFSELYQQAKREQNAISANITDLEKAMRAKMEEQNSTKRELTESTLSWPVSKRTPTTTFHDPEYPFRYLFEHPAIDIPVPQSTQIKAPAEGYVLTAKDAGMGYSYIALIHADGLSTVYGHVSKIYVKVDDYVAKGDLIGLTGGMPGTRGAGNLTTGPHLHFEVRYNGIPVDPFNYLQ